MKISDINYLSQILHKVEALKTLLEQEFEALKEQDLKQFEKLQNEKIKILEILSEEEFVAKAQEFHNNQGFNALMIQTSPIGKFGIMGPNSKIHDRRQNPPSTK